MRNALRTAWSNKCTGVYPVEWQSNRTGGTSSITSNRRTSQRLVQVSLYVYSSTISIAGSIHQSSVFVTCEKCMTSKGRCGGGVDAGIALKACVTRSSAHKVHSHCLTRTFFIRYTRCGRSAETKCPTNGQRSYEDGKSISSQTCLGLAYKFACVYVTSIHSTSRMLFHIVGAVYNNTYNMHISDFQARTSLSRPLSNDYKTHYHQYSSS